MKIIDAGHIYLLTSLDGDLNQKITFVKRVGPNFPGNKNSHPGTLMQELLRCLIDRLKYVDKQIYHPLNILCIWHLRMCLYLLEQRAAERHGKLCSADLNIIENQEPVSNGHLVFRERVVDGAKEITN